jgi:tryptophanyl-tRNA synthetase
MTHPSNRIMAGMRIWQNRMHLGTFYGWIVPLRELSSNNEVLVLLADLQSIENFPSYLSLRTSVRHLKNEMRSFLPQAKVYIESDFQDFDRYAIQAASIFKKEFYKRLGSFKESFEPGKETSFLKCLYPCMMVADVIKLQPGWVLAKNGDKAPHVDVINDILKKGNHLFGWPQLYVYVLNKSPVYIPDISGQLPMRRNRPDMAIEIHFGMTAKEIEKSLLRSNHPERHGPDISRCKVISQIWKVVTQDTVSLSACLQKSIDCVSCVRLLSKKISTDLGGEPI